MKNRLICDCCGKEIESFTDYTCYICNKTICPECVGHMEMCFDDYSEVYCEHCWEIGEKYRIEIEKHQEAIDKLQCDWDNECKK